jgi:hypothetical protein
MPPLPARDDARLPTAAEANEQLRAYVRAHGTGPWSREELAVLAQLRRAWLAARVGRTEAA